MVQQNGIFINLPVSFLRAAIRCEQRLLLRACLLHHADAEKEEKPGQYDDEGEIHYNEYRQSYSGVMFHDVGDDDVHNMMSLLQTCRRGGGGDLSTRK